MAIIANNDLGSYSITTDDNTVKEQDPNQWQREEFKRMKEKLESVEMIKIMQNFSFIKGAKEMDMIKIKLDKTIICICVIAIILFVVAVL